MCSGFRRYSLIPYHSFFFFFFQAEDGIRDIGVTGVQTCALPILTGSVGELIKRTQWWGRQMLIWGVHVHVGISSANKVMPIMSSLLQYYPHLLEIGRASCRERV